MLRPTLFAAAVLAGVPHLPPTGSAPAGEESRPSPSEGKGGAYAPVEEATILVEGAPIEAQRLFMLAPDPEFERRYAPSGSR